MKGFESQVEEVRLLDRKKLTMHSELYHDSLETCWRLLLVQLVLESLAD